MNKGQFKQAIKEELAYARAYVKEHRAAFNATPYFPFCLWDEGGSYGLMLTFGEGMFFFELLAKYGLYGNGPTWEGIIEQILAKDMPEVLDVAWFDSEVDACLLYVESAKDQRRVAHHLHEILIDQPRLESYLGTINRAAMD